MINRSLLVAGLLVALNCLASGGEKDLTKVKVEVVKPSSGFVTSERTMTSKKSSTSAVVLNAIINNEHVMLTCYEQRRGCTFIGPGTYDGELKTHSGGHIHWSTGHDGMDPDLWLTFTRPLDHAVLREHYKVSGSW